MLARLLHLIAKESEKEGNVSIDSSLCLNLRSGRILCRACQEVCPVQGITLQGVQVQINNCISCGLCAVACPTGVLDSLWSAANQALITAKDPRPYLWISCRNTDPIDDGMQINCLGELTIELISYLLSKRIDKVKILYKADACNECICKTGLDNWKLTKAKLDMIYPQNTVAIYESVFEDQDQKTRSDVDYARRGLLRSLSSESRGIVSELLPHLDEFDDTNCFKQRLSLRRQLFKYSVSRLNQEKLNIIEPGYQLKPRIGDSCTFCGSCSRLCPSGALQMIETQNEQRSISIDPINCNMCGLCEKICPSEAITVSGASAGISDDQGALHGEKIICVECGMTYWRVKGKADSLCPGCSNGRINSNNLWSESIIEKLGGAESEGKQDRIKT